MHVMVADASRFVASLRTQSAFLEQALYGLVAALADFGLVYVVDGDRLTCAAFAHTTRRGRHLLRTLKHAYQLRRSDRDSTVAQVVRIGRPALRRHISPEPEPPPTPTAAHVSNLHRRLAARSVLAVPIHGRDGVLGALMLAYAGSGRQYSPEDIPVVEHVAMQIGFALDHGAPSLKGRASSAVRRVLPRLRGRV